MYRIIIVFILLSCFYSITIGANESLIYISPIPNSIRVAKSTEIILRPKDEYLQQYSENPPQLDIEGSISGIHSYSLYISPDGKSYVYKNLSDFAADETVTVSTSGGQLSSKDNYNIYFTFTISDGDLNSTIEPERLLVEELLSNEVESVRKEQSTKYDDPLPDDMLKILPVSQQITSGSKYYFTGTCQFNEPYNSYIMILDAFATPLFYRKINGPNYDFKKQKNGLLSYYDGSKSKFMILDNYYNLIDSIKSGYGYKTDFHEFLIDDNDHYLYFCYDKQRVDMSQYVQNGNPEAIVYGLILQEKDENKEVIFQWRSWDHTDITDAADAVDLTQTSIDYIHGNSISIDHDGNLVISLRNFNEVMKIDRHTGETLYRLGGKNNQFTFMNENYEFNWQHDARILPNGHITIFDNGTKRSPRFTRGIQYEIDESAKTAELVWEYNPSPSIYAGSMCNLQTLENGSRVMSWAGWGGMGFSEIMENGTIINDYDIESSGRLYRVFKDSWESEFITASPSNIEFNLNAANLKDTAEVTLTNHTTSVITINQVFNKDDVFVMLNDLPFTIEPGGVHKISIEFSPGRDFVTFFDNLQLSEDKPGKRRSIRVPLTGSLITNIEDTDHLSSQGFRIDELYPNPFNSTTNITFSIPYSGEVELKIFDITGREIESISKHYAKGTHKIPLSMNEAASGVYFVSLLYKSLKVSRKIVLLK
ncbi:MAG: hypothetical protein SCALA702_06210 [Melioribacteraceae bacterium]|nr:MAG: hypothetical protein SCALA702_06210 [Melioribacteraceae bacterium]